MLLSFGLLTFCFVLPSNAVALDPAQAEREARDALRDLLRNQSSERTDPQRSPPTKPRTDKPGPDKANPGRAAKPSPVPGSDLPAICIGCDAR